MSLSVQSVRGAAWTILTSVLSRAVGLVGTLVLVRFLAPDDYGVVSAASVVVLSAGQLSTIGIGIYLIAHPDSSREVAFHATVIHVTLGAIALGAVLLLSRHLGIWMGEPSLARYLPGLALAVVLDRVAYVPERILIRALRFRRVAAARSAGELIYTAVSVAAAIAGWGGYAIVVGNVARSLLRAALLTTGPERRDWLDFSPLRARTLRTLAGYGVTVSLGGIAGFATRRWDNLLVLRFFGAGVMGAYNLAYNLADIPAVQVGEQITDVLFASFATMAESLRLATLIRSVRLLALLLFPLAVGLGAVAPTVTAAFLTHGWSQVAPMLMLLSALSISRPIALAITSYLQAQRRPGTATLLEILSLVLLVLCLCTIGRIGPLWACVAVGVAFGARTLAGMLVLRLTDGVPLRALLAPLVPPLLACVPMVLAIVVARTGLHRIGMEDHPRWELLAEMAIGALVYSTGALVIARESTRELIRLVKRTRETGE